MAGKHGGKRRGAGRKSKADELNRAEFFDACLVPDDRRLIVANLSRIAKSTKDNKAAVSAASLLFSYVFGKPTEKHEHSGTDGDAIEIIVKHVQKAD